MIQSTSFQSYRALKDSGVLGERQREIADFMQSNQAALTDREISKVLGYSDPNAVRPRRRELVKMGVLRRAESRKCKVSGTNAFTWMLNRFPLTLNQECGFQCPTCGKVSREIKVLA